MKRKTIVFTLCAALSILACVLLWRSHDGNAKTNAEHGIKIVDTAKAIVTMQEPEAWIRSISMGDTMEEIEEKFTEIIGALCAEHELHVLNRRSPLTEDEEEGHRGTPTVKMLMMIESYTEALLLARWGLAGQDIPPAERMRVKSSVHSVVDSKEGSEVARIRHKSKMTDEDVEYLNNIIERLNQTAKTNSLLRNYWTLPCNATPTSSSRGGNNP